MKGFLNNIFLLVVFLPALLMGQNEVSIISIYPDSCLDSECVWPGDANFDGAVNSKDIIQIGSLFSQTSDNKRTMATTNWVEQACSDWEVSKFNVNAKHADSDGNGIIDFLDTEVVEKNYSSVSLKTDETIPSDSLGPPIYILSNYDTVNQSDSIIYSIYLGSDETPAENVYGVSMKWQHETPEVFGSDNSADFNGSWLGTKNVDMIANGFPLEDGIDIGMSRTDQQNRTGKGRISTVRIIVPDNLGEIQKDINLVLTDLLIISFEGDTIHPNIILQDPVVILRNRIKDLNILEKNVLVYPNPNSGILNLESRLQLDKIRIVDLSGRSLYVQINPSLHEVFDLSGFGRGLYVIEFQSGGVTAYERVFVE